MRLFADLGVTPVIVMDRRAKRRAFIGPATRHHLAGGGGSQVRDRPISTTASIR